MTNLQKLIECWRPIEEAPKLQGVPILARISGVHPDSGKPYTWSVVEWSDDFKMFVPEDIQCQFEDDEEDFKFPYGMEEWCKELSEWMPYDTPEKLAKIVGVLADDPQFIDADGSWFLNEYSDEIVSSYSNHAQHHGHIESLMAAVNCAIKYHHKQVLQQAEKIAGDE